jgi:F0F1-type ATP synthase gamma subunit
MNPEFPQQILEIFSMPNFMKIRPVQAELFHEYRQTDITQLVVVLRNFTNAPKTSFTKKRNNSRFI